MSGYEYSYPDQELVQDAHGTIRFAKNRVVDKLLDIASQHGYSLNEIAIDRCNGLFTDNEVSQLNQLTGYSVSGWGGLSYVTEEQTARNDERAEAFSKTLIGKALTANKEKSNVAT